jgi:tetraacyldisaccharide 4'-kinase
MNSLLIPFGKIYGRVMDARNALYDRGFFSVHDLGATTISVGNLTTGGTGKTPLVAMIAEILAERSEAVCILTRGYGRKNAGERVLVSDGKSVLADAEIGGDEPVELARKLLGKAIVIANANRVSAGIWAKEKFGVTVFILDDGFQHRRVKRDLDIVCIDATNPFGGGEALPAGRLREPLENVKRADVIVITRANLVEEIENLRSQISGLNREAEIFLARNTIKRILSLNEFQAPRHSSVDDAARRESDIGWERLRNEGDPDNVDEEVRILVFCALGNPNNFFHLIDEEFDKESMDEFDLSIFKKFPDHHFYSQDDVDQLEKQAIECSVDVLVTTAKDAVKLSGLEFTMPCYVIEIDTEIDDTEAFRDLLVSS